MQEDMRLVSPRDGRSAPEARADAKVRGHTGGLGAGAAARRVGRVDVWTRSMSMSGRSASIAGFGAGAALPALVPGAGGSFSKALALSFPPMAFVCQHGHDLNRRRIAYRDILFCLPNTGTLLSEVIPGRGQPCWSARRSTPTRWAAPFRPLPPRPLTATATRPSLTSALSPWFVSQGHVTGPKTSNLEFAVQKPFTTWWMVQKPRDRDHVIT